MTDAASHSADLAGRPDLATPAIRRDERRVGLLVLCLLALAVGSSRASALWSCAR